MSIDNFNYITNQIFPHGLGTRIALLINAIAYSKFENKEFIFTPFSHQNTAGEFDANPMTRRIDYLEACNRWDTLLNLDGKLITDIPDNELGTVLALCHTSIKNSPPQGHEGYLMINKVRGLRGEIRDEFFKIPPKKEDGKLKVSVHIRRDDIIGMKSRFIGNGYYIETIGLLEEFLIGNNSEYELTIYTQRNGFDVSGFEKHKIIYDTDMSDNDVWVNLVNSDIIIASNSAFSTSVGLLTDGVFIHPQVDNFPLMDDWLYGSELTQDKLIEKLNINKIL